MRVGGAASGAPLSISRLLDQTGRAKKQNSEARLFFAFIPLLLVILVRLLLHLAVVRRCWPEPLRVDKRPPMTPEMLSEEFSISARINRDTTFSFFKGENLFECVDRAGSNRSNGGLFESLSATPRGQTSERVNECKQRARGISLSCLRRLESETRARFI